MKNSGKRLLKALYWLAIIFIIVTAIITITKLSTPLQSRVDLNNLSSIQKEAFYKRYGNSLNKTTFLSFEKLSKEVVGYYKMILKGELGYIYGVQKRYTPEGQELHELVPIKPIGSILKTGIGRSMKLLGSSLGIALILGILKGVNDSRKGKKNSSTFKLFTTVIGLSLPVIFIAPLLQFITLRLLVKYGIKIPVVGHESYKNMILPIITLAILPTMYIARLTSIAIDNAYDEEYVRTAISKGSSKRRVLWLHVFRNAIVELTGSIPSTITIVISDLVLVEYLFMYRGLTQFMLDYYEKGQSDVVTGFALSLSAIYALFYLIFKILKFALDPKGRRSAV